MKMDSKYNQNFLEKILNVNFSEFYFAYVSNGKNKNALLKNIKNDYIYICTQDYEIFYIAKVMPSNNDDFDETAFFNGEHKFFKKIADIGIYSQSIYVVDENKKCNSFPIKDKNFKLSDEDLIIMKLLKG